MNSPTSIIPIIRRFNRYYTKVLGLLDKNLLDSEFSLSEVRVLYEIGQSKECKASMLIEQLGLDPGYLSRMLKRFEKLGLTYRVQSKEDGRASFLYLTDLGEETLAHMNELSDEQISNMIIELPEQSRLSIAKSMTTIQNKLSGNSEERTIEVRTELRPGDVGALIHLHGWVYAKECGYNHIFEGYVCKTFYDVLQTYNPDKDRFWLAETDNEIVGSIAVIGHPGNRAQIRWFILHPDCRGMGIGKKLIHEAIAYCKEKGYSNVFLETTEDQKTAITMYTKQGFVKTKEQENEAWGVLHIEQTYELKL
ncbi:bifunctional helix-turn-helix transcriptional regulator/GNAT family N-acetyltransferase [Paenibacillus tundrae]|uniref:DNA-binding MarR family transcriptional regulator/GNAT superfamily N-acetyltransferase n=1 Tax=Paenibacillus tundrae TaxID=528187 RepID=A0ABT9WA90_9BACL|nr:helix-turn-helix domain-containing GNAT family N-acetyltransferase [Paenibacillus tundrae]MDQ0170181.1 DNA-binding MarR family transcriptional regulator/GNAT superfamily N-acetyltransferase [Paenibacillus tundrae]